MKFAVPISAALLTIIGCTTSSHSPDAIRERTANATAMAARDTRAVAQGIVEGLRTRGPLNINKASKDQLETLPGIDSTRADRIIAGRPYQNSAELVRRRILTKREYNQIAARVEAH